MRSTTMLSALALLLAVVLDDAASAQEDVSALLFSKTQAFSDAGQRGDGKAMAALLDDRVLFFNEGGDMATKADMASSTPAAQPGISTKMTITDWHCEVHGDVAVASFIDDQQQDWHGQPFHARYRSVETWLRKDAGWKMIGSETIALLDDPQSVMLPAATLEDYTGVYEAAPGLRFMFTSHDGNLYASTGGSPPTLQKAEVKDLFFTPGRSRFTKLFERDSLGRVTGFVLRREGHDIRFRRV